MVRNVVVVIIGLALLSEGFLVYQNVQLKRRLKLFSSSGAVPEHLQRRICEHRRARQRHLENRILTWPNLAVL